MTASGENSNALLPSHPQAAIGQVGINRVHRPRFVFRVAHGDVCVYAPAARDRSPATVRGGTMTTGWQMRRSCPVTYVQPGEQQQHKQHQHTMPTHRTSYASFALVRTLTHSLGPSVLESLLGLIDGITYLPAFRRRQRWSPKTDSNATAQRQPRRRRRRVCREGTTSMTCRRGSEVAQSLHRPLVRSFVRSFVRHGRSQHRDGAATQWYGPSNASSIIVGDAGH